MQKIIQIHLCLLKLSRKQESVTDGRTDGRTEGRTNIRIDLTLCGSTIVAYMEEHLMINNAYFFTIH